MKGRLLWLSLSFGGSSNNSVIFIPFCWSLYVLIVQLLKMNSQDSLFSSSSSVKTEAFSSPSLTEQKQKVSLFYSFITTACVEKETSLKSEYLKNISSEIPTFLTMIFFLHKPLVVVLCYKLIRLIGKKDMKQKGILKHLWQPYKPL